MAVKKGARQAFGKRVLTLREEQELTQIELGKLVGVTGTCVWNWESGNTFPRPNAMSKLAQALKTSVDYLSVGNGPSTSTPQQDHRPLSKVMEEAREAVASAAGIAVGNVRIVIDYGA